MSRADATRPDRVGDRGAAAATVMLVRHGRSTANGAGILAGRSPGVDLDDTGVRQAAGLVDRLAECRIARIVSSPLLRCRSTVAPLAAALGLTVTADDRLAEVDYGRWTGRRLADLATEPLWRTVQAHPSAAVFPGGEGLAAVSARAVAAAREYAGIDVGAGEDARADTAGDTVADTDSDPGAGGAILICSHGDVISSILADALGMHLDLFQRLVVSPASISVVRYTPLRTFVERVNDTGSLAGIGVPPAVPVAAGSAVSVPTDGSAVTDPAGRAVRRAADDAVVGGDPGVRI